MIAAHTHRHRGRFAFTCIVALFVAIGAGLGAGCGSDIDEDNEANGHEDAGAIEIETRGAASELVARWDPESGWTDGEGGAIDELPPLVDGESGDLLPLREQGDRASLTVRFFSRGGELLEMDTLERDDETGERECTEFSARYFPLDDETDVIAWPNVSHPENDSRRAPHQFVERNGDLTGIYHCDHVHIYPERVGTVEVEFVLWHIDHSDDVSEPITLRVESPD